MCRPRLTVEQLEAIADEIAPQARRVAIIWPMPELALELACTRARARAFASYPRVAHICDPLE